MFDVHEELYQCVLPDLGDFEDSAEDFEDSAEVYEV